MNKTFMAIGAAVVVVAFVAVASAESYEWNPSDRQINAVKNFQLIGLTDVESLDNAFHADDHIIVFIRRNGSFR